MIAKEQFLRLATNISALGITLLTAAGCAPATPPATRRSLLVSMPIAPSLASYWKCSIMTESTVALAVLIPWMMREVNSLSLYNAGPSTQKYSR